MFSTCQSTFRYNRTKLANCSAPVGLPFFLLRSACLQINLNAYSQQILADHLSLDTGWTLGLQKWPVRFLTIMLPVPRSLIPCGQKRRKWQAHRKRYWHPVVRACKLDTNVKCTTHWHYKCYYQTDLYIHYQQLTLTDVNTSCLINTLDAQSHIQTAATSSQNYYWDTFQDVNIQFNSSRTRLIDWLIEHGFTSASTQYRLYGRRFLQQQNKVQSNLATGDIAHHIHQVAAPVFNLCVCSALWPLLWGKRRS